MIGTFKVTSLNSFQICNTKFRFIGSIIEEYCCS